MLACALALALLASAGSLDPLAALTLPLFVALAAAHNLYGRDELILNKTTIDEAPQIFHVTTFFCLLVAVLQGALAAAEVVLLWASLLLLVIGLRRVARAVARRVAPVERCLFVGGAAAHARLLRKLDDAGCRAVVVARMALPRDARHADDDPGAVLCGLVEDLGVDRVIIEPGEGDGEATLDFVREAKATGARVSLLPRILEVVGAAIEIDDLDGLPLLGVRRFGLSATSRALKRSFDIAGATLGLLLVGPLLVMLGIAVRLDSPGPAIYRQTRVGRGGRRFAMLKLRTMVDGADALKRDLHALNESEGLFKIAADPRVTRVGRLLRRCSLDELPQLVNVLRGEMSLVGPRPLVVDEDALITGLDRQRLFLTPGMTGRWQILGARVVPLAEMVKIDYLYVAGWSLWSDVKILVRTLPHILASRGI